MTDQPRHVRVTGSQSYIGAALRRRLEAENNRYAVDEIDLRDDNWRSAGFSGVDAVFHVAAIVHRKKAPRELYDRVNTDLAVEAARRAKDAGVKHFVFLSTMAVYGRETGRIGADTPTAPRTPYGASKLAAEEQLAALADDGFRVAVLRPPMVYGPGCPGNYRALRKAALSFPFFPDFPNERSMVYIGTLAEAARWIIERRLGGLFHPQNADYVNTADLARRIAAAHGRRLRTTRLFNLPLRAAVALLPLFQKVFGSLVYEAELSRLADGGEALSYQDATFERTVLESEAVQQPGGNAP